MFKGDADEETHALRRSRSTSSGRGRVGLGTVGLREIDVPVDPGAARTPTAGTYWLNGRRTVGSRRPSAPAPAAWTSG